MYRKAATTTLDFCESSKSFEKYGTEVKRDGDSQGADS